MRDLEVLETINVRGAHGQVYKIRVRPGQDLDGLAAMKVPTAQPDDQFAREMEVAELLARYRHPYIVRFLGTGIATNESFILMELHEEGDLEDLIRTNGPLPLREALDLLTQVGEALHFLHRLGVYHRDIKAENIIIAEHGQPKVADFGTAHIHRRGGVVIPGRQGRLTAREADRRRDALMLGEVLYHAISGRKLYDARLFALAQRRRLAPAASTRQDAHLYPAVSLRIDAVLRRALDPAQTLPYPGVRYFLADLRRLRSECDRERAPVRLTRRTGQWRLPPGPGFLERAEAQAWQATEREPENAAPWVQLGNVHLVAMRPAAAERAYAQALQRSPDHVIAQLNLAYVLALTGHWDRALQTATAAGSRADPRLRAPIRARHIESARHLVEDAEALYSHKDPKNPVCQLFLGYAHDALGHEREAEAAYRQSLALDPKFAPAAEALAFLALRQTDARAALAHALRAVRVGEERAEAWLALGSARLALDQSDEAATALSRAVGLSPNHPYCRRLLARAWLALGELEHAEEDCRYAAMIDPCWVEARLAWGDLLALTGRQEEARMAYQHAITYNPECLDPDGRPGLSFALT